MNDWHQRSFIPMTREGVRFFRDLKVVPLTAINQLSRKQNEAAVGLRIGGFFLLWKVVNF